MRQYFPAYNNLEKNCILKVCTAVTIVYVIPSYLARLVVPNLFGLIHDPDYNKNRKSEIPFKLYKNFPDFVSIEKSSI